MKVSDILTLVAVLAAGASAYFAYESWQDFHGKPFDDTVRGDKGAAKLMYKSGSPNPKVPLAATLRQRNKFLEERKSELEAKKGKLGGLQKEVGELQKANQILEEEYTQASVEFSETDQKTRANESKLRANTEAIKNYQEKFAASGNAEELTRQVSENRMRRKQAEEDLATENVKFEAAVQRKENLEVALAAIRRKETMQQSGVMEADFRTTVREVFSRWGFVTINGGASRGVNAKTKLHVMRGGDKIADLQVTTVEPNVAVCAIVPGSLSADMAIAPGDRIVVAKVETAPVEILEPAPAAAPAPAPAPAADPFGEIPAAAPAEPAGF